MNNAGLYIAKKWEDVTLADIDFDFNQYLRGPFAICKRAMPSLIENKGKRFCFRVCYFLSRFLLAGPLFQWFHLCLWQFFKVSFRTIVTFLGVRCLCAWAFWSSFGVISGIKRKVPWINLQMPLLCCQFRAGLRTLCGFSLFDACVLLFPGNVVNVSAVNSFIPASTPPKILLKWF